MKEYEPIDLKKVTTYSLDARGSKVSLEKAAGVYKEGSSFATFLDTIPDILAGQSLRCVINRLTHAHGNNRGIILGMGAHMIKCGLGPIITDLIRQKLITGIAMNGAGVIHDVELALAGKTSEDVAEQLQDGSFGMARETGEFINGAIASGHGDGLGFGESVGRALSEIDSEYGDQSILLTAYRNHVPVTVHVAIGTDIIHMHPDADGSAIGGASHKDFRIFCSMVRSIDSGGVFMNAGSAVIIPEVFLKAVSVVRNLGYSCKDFTTVNLDFHQHYRPMENVVKRPVLAGGEGYHITGHHELMFPLLVAGYKEILRRQ